MKRFLKEYTFGKSSFGSWGMLRQDAVISLAVFLYWTNKNTCGTCPPLPPTLRIIILDDPPENIVDDFSNIS